MKSATPLLLCTRVTVTGPITPRGLMALLALRSKELQQRAARQGRGRGEVEIDRQSGAYYLTWKDEHTVPDEAKSHFPINHAALKEGSGHYVSTESIEGVRVKLLRNCEGRALAPGEVREVMAYRLKRVAEQLGTARREVELAKSGSEERDRLVDRVERLTALHMEYQWLLALLDGPQHT